MDITFNKPTKSFIKEKYNIWYTEQVTEQLNEDKDQQMLKFYKFVSGQSTTC